MPLNTKNKAYLFIGGAIFVVFVILYLNQNFSNKTVLTEAKIKNIPLTVEIANSVKSRTRGLSGRSGLVDRVGMLFVYPDAAERNFWMKDMRFPIDIIWIKDYSVVGFNQNLPIPMGNYIPRVVSPGSVDLVLEVEAGFVAKNNIKIGDKFELLTSIK